MASRALIVGWRDRNRRGMLDFETGNRVLALDVEEWMAGWRPLEVEHEISAEVPFWGTHLLHVNQ
jgi:hypothetical protein